MQPKRVIRKSYSTHTQMTNASVKKEKSSVMQPLKYNKYAYSRLNERDF